MKILILNSDYPQFLRWLYGQSPELANASYATQMAARNESLFGVADFYSRNFKVLGHQAAEIHINNSPLQAAWARENGLDISLEDEDHAPRAAEGLLLRAKRALRPYRAFLAPVASKLGLLNNTINDAQTEILLAQIEDFAPDVIINQEMHATPSSVVRQFCKKGRMLIGQCGIEPPPASELAGYDFAISILPWVVDIFRSHGLSAELNHLAFEPSILETLGPQPERDIPISFVGSLGSDHAQRLALLETIAKHRPLAMWMPNRSGLPPGSPLHDCYRGPAWGQKMYDVLRRSKITLNMHVSAARGMAANMRLYEATGAGAFLLTDNQKNLGTLFEPGVQVGVYDSVSDCVARIDRYLSADAEREAIAKAGQQQTFAHHTYRHRVEQLLGYIAKYAK